MSFSQPHFCLSFSSVCIQFNLLHGRWRWQGGGLLLFSQKKKKEEKKRTECGVYTTQPRARTLQTLLQYPVFLS